MEYAAKPAPEWIGVRQPWVGFAIDNALREAGFTIATRPTNGEPWWQMDGRGPQIVEVDAVKLMLELERRA